MSAARMYDPPDELGYTLELIQACELKDRDTIVADGRVPLLISEVRLGVPGFVSAMYSCLAGSGWRTYGSRERLEVLRPVREAPL